MNAIRPFDAAPDLLRDAEIINEFMRLGLSEFEVLAKNFDLGDDAEAGLCLAIALRAYAAGDMSLTLLTFKEFVTNAHHMPALGRVFEVFYKAVTHGFGYAATQWAQFAVEIYNAQPANPDAQRIVLEFFTYFGLWNHALTILAQLPADRFEPWRRHIMLARARAEGFQPQCRFSFLVLTWNRAGLLDRCLTEIRAKAGSLDYEILLGVNASEDDTAQVLKKHAIDQMFWNSRNDSIDYYRTLFNAAHGNILIVIDDNVVELPESFDLTLEHYLKTFSEFGYISFQPTLISPEDGERVDMEGAPDSGYREMERDGLTIHAGPVWGCCAAISKRDWLDIGGFYGVKMSKTIGEEPQIVRKLLMRDREGAMIRNQTVLKAY